jgi:hypothetical protein
LRFTVPAAAQRWQLRLRLQRITSREEVNIYILNGASSSPRQMNIKPWSRPMEVGEWVLAEGILMEGHLILSMQASNLILHLEQPEFS